MNKTSGFTLTETLVAMVIGLISIVAAFSAYNYYNKSYASVSQKVTVNKATIEPHFIEAGRINFANYDEVSTAEDVIISGEFSGTKLLDYRLFHNGRKRRYQQFEQNHALSRPFQAALRLQPGLNRVMVIVRSTTGHETTETLLITKK